METNIVREFDKKISDETIINIPRKKTYDEIIDELEEENENLASNMPWNTTEQATGISVDDAAKYSRNKLELFGNTSQDSTNGNTMTDTTNYSVEESGVSITSEPNGILTLNGTASAGINKSYGSIIPQTYNIPAGTHYVHYKYISGTLTGRLITNLRGTGDTTSNQIDVNTNAYQTDKSMEKVISADATITTAQVMISSGSVLNNLKIQIWWSKSSSTDYEPYTGGQPSPSPDYPQPIHVVTGNNPIEVTGKNLAKSFVNGTTLAQYQVSLYIDADFEIGKKYALSFVDKSVGNIYYRNENFMQNQSSYSITTTRERQTYYFECKDNDKTKRTVYIPNKGYLILKNSIALDNLPQFEDVQIEEVTSYNIPSTSYVPYYHAEYPINLGSLELCKIGNYQDYLYKENGNWYKYEAIDKIILNGSENIAFDTTKTITQVFNIRNVLKSHRSLQSVGYCNYFSNQPGDTEKFSYVNATNVAENLYIAINKTKASNVEEFKNWLNNHNIVFYYPITSSPTTQITDETLISQLDAIYENLQLVKGTNNITVTAEDLAPNMKLTYMQDLPSKLDKLEAMVIENS